MNRSRAWKKRPFLAVPGTHARYNIISLATEARAINQKDNYRHTDESLIRKAMSLRAAAVQTKTLIGADEERNVERALSYIDEAAERGAQIICFPETYPGPFRTPIRYSPIDALCHKAKEYKVYLIAGTIEYAGDTKEGCFNTEVLINADGRILGKYRRTTPRGPWHYKGSPIWDFDYVEGDELPVFDTELGKIGILVCSEVYVPELSRILALKGAEIVFMPSGAFKRDLWATWLTLIHARAIENLMFTVTCQNIFGIEDGLAAIAGPEEILVKSRKEGVFAANVDLDRIRWLRQTEDKVDYFSRWKTKPGVLKYWRRPELYRKYLFT